VLKKKIAKDFRIRARKKLFRPSIFMPSVLEVELVRDASTFAVHVIEQEVLGEQLRVSPQVPPATWPEDVDVSKVALYFQYIIENYDSKTTQLSTELLISEVKLFLDISLDFDEECELFIHDIAKQCGVIRKSNKTLDVVPSYAWVRSFLDTASSKGTPEPVQKRVQFHSSVKDKRRVKQGANLELKNHISKPIPRLRERKPMEVTKVETSTRLRERKPMEVTAAAQSVKEKPKPKPKIPKHKNDFKLELVHWAVCKGKRFKVVCKEFANVIPEDQEIEVTTLLDAIQGVLRKTSNNMVAAKIATKQQLYVEMYLDVKKDIHSELDLSSKNTFSDVWAQLLA
jgi:hypothetical protein